MAAAIKDSLVRMVGEGYDRPNAHNELPVDINYQGLADWLVSRQKLPADWHARVQAIQAKSAEAAAHIEPELLASVVGGGATPADRALTGVELGESGDSGIDYYAAVELRDRLAQTGERGVFGGLKGQAATWDKITQAYEKQCVFAGEAAHTLVQNTDYDIPYLRKQEAKLNQLITDLERKQADCIKSAASCAAAYTQECRSLGIAGVQVRQELLQLVGELPALFKVAVDKLQAPRIADAIEYYQNFTRYAHSSSSSSSSSAAPAVAAASTAAAVVTGVSQQEDLPTLQLIRRGLVQAPHARPAATRATAEHTDPVGLVPGSCSAAPASQPPEVDIDWDVSGPVAAAATAGGPSTAAVDIDWDVDVADAAGPSIDWEVEGAAVYDANEVAAPGTPEPLDVSSDTPAHANGDAAATVGGIDAGTIDWDIQLTDDAGNAPATGAPAEAAAPDVDWDIDTGTVGEVTATAPDLAGDGGSTSGVRTSAASSSGDDVARSLGLQLPLDATASGLLNAVLRLEADSDFRARLLDDLHELRAFLQQRRIELAVSSTAMLSALLPDSIQAVDAAAAAAMLAAVGEVLASLNAERLRQLLMISTSSRYLDRLVSDLQRKGSQEAKLQAAAREAVAKREESQRALVALHPRVAALIQRTRMIKEHVERTLSAQLFGGRAVNILGEINNTLSGA